MKLEEIDRVVRESLTKGNEVSKEEVFSQKQVEILSEAIKSAFEVYHGQTK